MVDILNGQQTKGASSTSKNPFGGNLLHDAAPSLKDPKGRLADLRRVRPIELEGQKPIDTGGCTGKRRAALGKELK